MAKGGIAFSILPLPENEKTTAYALSLVQRMEVVKRILMIAMAERAQEIIKEKLPNDEPSIEIKEG